MAGGGNAIRGSRVGAGPMGEAERGDAAPRQAVTYFCSTAQLGGRRSRSRPPSGLVGLPKCGLPAGRDQENAPPATKIEPYKTHLAYVKERRSDKEAPDILNEALQLLRSRRSPATSSSDRALGGTLHALTGHLGALSAR